MTWRTGSGRARAEESGVVRRWRNRDRRREPARTPQEPETDVIRLEGLTAFGRHGVFPFEREEGQEFAVDLALSVDIRRAAASDDLSDTVSYADVADEVVEILEGTPRNLLETVAEEIADAVLAHPGVVGAEVTIHKPQAPIAHRFSDVAVSVSRGVCRA